MKEETNLQVKEHYFFLEDLTRKMTIWQAPLLYIGAKTYHVQISLTESYCAQLTKATALKTGDNQSQVICPVMMETSRAEKSLNHIFVIF